MSAPPRHLSETLAARVARISLIEKLPPMRTLRALESKLKKIVPGSALIPRGDVHIDEIIANGHEFSTVGLRMRRGAPSNCHENAVNLFASGVAAGVGTGYACDGILWRQHSWGLDARGRILETTVKGRKYFGLGGPLLSALHLVLERRTA